MQALLNANLPKLQEHILWWVMSAYMDWRDVNADQRRANGATLLYLAAKAGKLEVVRRLVLEFGGDLEIHDAEDQHNALCMAASEGHPAVMAFLIEQEVAKGTRTLAEILDVPCKSHLPLIHHAVRAPHIDVVRFLVREMGVDLMHYPKPCENEKRHSEDADLQLE